MDDIIASIRKQIDKIELFSGMSPEIIVMCQYTFSDLETHILKSNTIYHNALSVVPTYDSICGLRVVIDNDYSYGCISLTNWIDYKASKSNFQFNNYNKFIEERDNK